MTFECVHCGWKKNLILIKGQWMCVNAIACDQRAK